MSWPIDWHGQPTRRVENPGELVSLIRTMHQMSAPPHFPSRGIERDNRDKVDYADVATSKHILEAVRMGGRDINSVSSMQPQATSVLSGPAPHLNRLAAGHDQLSPGLTNAQRRNRNRWRHGLSSIIRAFKLLC